MSMPILATKLFIPPLRSNYVKRAQLIERLNEGLNSKLILVSAPAGFGKTTLVSSWLQYLREDVARSASRAPTVAWLSLDEKESDPIRFLTYLVSAVQQAAPTIGKSVLTLLQMPQHPPLESLATNLLNEIAAHPEQIVVVLDDYHLVDAQTVDELLTFLLDHLPPQMHVVITTREDPQLPLHRLRARNQLVEVRAADLRLSPAEAATFLNRIMGLNLGEPEIAALEKRTEGWIAGLQLAALSMRGREDVAGFIKAFAGDNRYIVDYLAEEVLQRQPDPVRSFLLQTAILDQLNGALCNAVTGQRAGAQRLEELERSNLFVIPLDDKRQWYRYHHLFADVLRAHLLEQQPDQLPTLHQRASEWYEQNDMLSAAIPHALAARDFARAAHLIELDWPSVHSSTFQSPEFLRWMQALPQQFVRARPVLSLGYAWELLDVGDLEAAEQRLADAELWLKTEEQTSPPTISDEELFQILPAAIAIARCYLAQSVGDLAGAVKAGQRALALLPKEDLLRRGQAAALLGLVYWAGEDLESAYQSLAEGMDSLRQMGNLSFALSGTYGLADIRMAQGRLHDASAIYQGALKLALAEGEPLPQATAELYLGLGDLYREQGDLEAAREHLQKSAELSAQSSLPTWPYRFRFAQSRMKQSEGDLAGALALLDEAEHFYFRGPVPDVQPIAAQKVRLWLKQDRLSEALAWVRAAGLSVNDDLSYLREFEHITLARVLIAQFRHEQNEDSLQLALTLLDRLRSAAEKGGRNGTLIEIFVLQAMAQAARGEKELALTPLRRALILGEPEGYVRIFANEGEPMARLLAEAQTQRIMPVYAAKLRAAFSVVTEQVAPRGAQTISGPANTEQPLIDPLSEREIEVLQLVAQGFSNREIAEKLYIALSTVKGHNRVIFEKLQVQRRTEAVAKARELGLV